jgi:hypothetical protein
MELSAKQTTLEEIAAWRDLYRQEMNCQIIHDSIHSRRGWTLEYLLNAGGVSVGYGSIAVAGPWKDKPTLYEFYVLPHYRSLLFDLFSALLAACGANRIETQSNDPLLTPMLHTFARDVISESILYHDKLTTALAPIGAVFRRAISSDDPQIPPDRVDVGRDRAFVALQVHRLDAQHDLVNRRVFQGELVDVANPDFFFPVRRGGGTNHHDKARQVRPFLRLSPAQDGVVTRPAAQARAVGQHQIAGGSPGRIRKSRAARGPGP